MYGKKTETGGHAFPPGFAATAHAGYREGSSGMTLRDWFAGQALGALVGDKTVETKGDPAGAVSRIAYAFADSMIAERSK